MSDALPKNINEAFRKFVLYGEDGKFGIDNLSNKTKLALFEECFKFSSKFKDGKLHATVHDVANRMHVVRKMHINREKGTFTYGKETKERKFYACAEDFKNKDSDIFLLAYWNHCKKYGFLLSKEISYGRYQEYKVAMYDECSKSGCGIDKTQQVWKIKKKKKDKESKKTYYRDTSVHLPVMKRRTRKRNRKLIENLYFKKHVENAKVISVVLYMKYGTVKEIIRDMKKERNYDE